MTKQVMFTSYMSAQRAFFITAIIAVVAPRYRDSNSGDYY